MHISPKAPRESLSLTTFITVSVLMSARSNPPAPLKPKSSTRQSVFRDRDGLGVYIANPASYPSSLVITYSDAFVTIHDRYPKSSIHLLLLPRDPTKILLHPFIALSDPVFCAQVKAEVRKLKILVAKELKRRFGAESAAEKKREEALDKGEEAEGEVPEGRDWSEEVIAGIHAHPSMNHLHIHILSRDFHSDCMRHRKHYNSFHTPFLIDIEDFPLAKDDRRRHPGREGYLDEALRCWRCGKGFGKSFASLKRHLEEEFQEWKIQ